MKKTFITFLSAVMLLSVGFNATSCSDDDDNNSSEIKSSADQGTEDGKVFGAAYSNIKTAYTTGGASGASLAALTEATTLVTYGQKYKNSQDKAYKAAFIASASGATGWAESEIESYLNGTDLSSTATAIATLVKLFAGNGSSN